MKYELYNIRCAKKTEYGRIRDFINKDWKVNHILAVSKKLFDFQHLRNDSDLYDFVIAECKENREIHAVYGYINSAIYDEESNETPNAVWGALWKVKKDVQNQEISKIGLGVLFYILDMFPISPFITLGLSGDSQKIFKGLNFEFGKMNHYYFANKNCLGFNIIEAPLFNEQNVVNDITLKKYNFERDIVSDYLPSKNNKYLINRYLKHPYYTYELWALHKKKEIINVWVVRLSEFNNSKCLRLVDMVGRTKYMPDASSAIINLLDYYNAEYIDCYNYGISQSEFENLGFMVVSPPTVVPNYFEPFEKRNVDIHFAYLSDKQLCIFKGDGDQDRPSMI